MRLLKQNSYNRILIRNNGELFKFVNYTMNFNDGSFYLFFEDSHDSKVNFLGGDYDFTRKYWVKPISSIIKILKNKPKLSYHATGRINFDFFVRSTAYAEPISRITQTTLFLNYYVPYIKTLPRFNKTVDMQDYIMEITDDIDKLFSFIISPPAISFRNPENFQFVSININNLFSLTIFDNKKLLPNIEIPVKGKHFFLEPKFLMYDKEQINQKEAIIYFHQKLNNTEGCVVEGPDRNGIYKLIFPNCNCIKPYEIIFEDSKYKTEIIKIEKDNPISIFYLKDAFGNKVKSPVLCSALRFL